MDKIAESEGSSGIGVHGAYKKQKHILLSIPNIDIYTTVEIERSEK